MLNFLSRNIINQLKSSSSKAVSSLLKSKQLQPPPLYKLNFSTTTTTTQSPPPPPPTTCKFETFSLSKTSTRSLLKLTGPDTLPFLQGLITNDISHLVESRPAIYALFLNHQGRVLYDTILFSVKEEGERSSVVFIECDSEVKSDLVKHLKTYKLRKKVEVVDVEGEVDLWVVFDHGHTTLAEESSLKKQEEECCGPTTQTTTRKPPPSLPITTINSSIHTFNDPRVTELGWRVLVPRESKSSIFPPPEIIVQSEEASYKRLRYVLGVAEGVKELPVGAALPLESNADYLHGVSFHKGCYVGQELTARTHHTGVVRKRVMPVRLPDNNTSTLDTIDPSTLDLVVGQSPSAANTRSLGKIRGISGTAGIGLIRIEQALAAGPELKIQNHCKVEVVKPFWWPKEAAKSGKLSKA